jgi:signal transduction histidine kinase
MRLLPRSLKGQFILLMLVTLIISQAASLLVLLDDQTSRMKNEWFRNVLTRVATLKEIMETTPAELHPKILKSANSWAVRFSEDPQPLNTPNGVSVSESMTGEIAKLFGDSANQIKVTINTSPNEETQMELLLGDLWRDIKRTLFPKSSFIPKPPKRPTYAHISLPLKSGGWLNVIVMPRGFAPPASSLLIQLATMGALSALGIILVLSRLTKPLRELASAASALGRGERSTKLEEKGPSEIAETIHAFNDMQERLTTFIHDRAKMLAALGHDLRTPITSLKLRAEFIEDEEIRDKILETLDEMLEMAESSLSYAREEAVQEETRLVDVGALTSSVCADFADTGHDVICAEPGVFALRCRPVGLKRALRNIVENALAYGQRARISVERKQGQALIIVDDDGPGIPESEREKVFKPFVRLEASRNKATGGVGLGLAIARTIVRSHGGDIALQNRPQGGLRVLISLPGVETLSAPHGQAASSAGRVYAPHPSAAE